MLKILRIFYRYLFSRPYLMVVFLTTITLGFVAQSVQPYFYKLFVDAIPSSNFGLLFKIMVAFVGLRFFADLILSIGRTIGDLVMISVVPKADIDVFKHLQDLDFAFHSSKSSGALVNKMRRGSNVFWSLYDVLNFRVLEFLVSVLVMFYFFRNLNLGIILLALLSMFLSLVAAKIFIPKNIEARGKMNKTSDKITGVIVDNMINFDTVKMFAKEDWEIERLKRQYKVWKKHMWDYSLSFRYMGVSLSLVVNSAFFVILFFILSKRGGFELEPGNFILVVGFLQRFNNVTFELVWNLRDVAKNFEDIRKYFEILDEQIQVKDPKNPVKVRRIMGEVEYKGVSFAYEYKQSDAVKNINLKIRQGQSVALVGRSGAGKTTMVKLLMRFYDVNHGKVLVDGINIKDFAKSNLRSFMGVVPQEPILFNNTIGYNIGYGKERAGKREIKAAAKLARIDDFIESLPKKYNTMVGERGVKLSGGQKQRVAIARMILSEPEIIIFDEATSQLDSESERLIQEAFWKASEDKTTIIIAHRLSTVMRADKIVVMEKGRIIEIGSHNELINKKDSLYNHFWRLQLAN